jgi:hypothetical protein
MISVKSTSMLHKTLQKKGKGSILKLVNGRYCTLIVHYSHTQVKMTKERKKALSARISNQKGILNQIKKDFGK